MRRTFSLCAALCGLTAAGMLAIDTHAQPVELTAATQAGGAVEGSGPCPPFTIAKGERSGWGMDQPLFSGAELVIRDRDAWRLFWHVHARETVPPPPVDFRHRVVLVAIQGRQPTAGGPNISIVNVEEEGPFTRVMVVDDERPGPDEEITNPFHIVTVCRSSVPAMRAVVFQHVRPFPESGVVVGRVFAEPPEGEPIPLPETHVVLIREGQEPRHALSGRDGSYFFVNVEPGDYVLLAEHPGFEPAEFPIFVPPATLVRHDFLLTPQPPEDGAIEGRVLGENPEGEPFPLGQALVQLFRGEEEVARRLTNDAGVFVFERVPPGAYALVASHEGFFPQEALIEVEAGAVTEHVFVLEARPHDPPGALVGRVLGVLDEGHHVPLRGALVRLFDGEGEVQRTRTDDSGGYAMFHVPPGRYVAVAEAEGWAAAEAEIEIRSGETTRHVFLLERP